MLLGITVLAGTTRLRLNPSSTQRGQPTSGGMPGGDPVHGFKAFARACPNNFDIMRSLRRRLF